MTTQEDAARAAGLRLRPGDQQLPEVNDSGFIQDLVIADIEKRRELGIQRYGTALQPFNGRNALQDLYEELLDAAMYIRQKIEEEKLSDPFHCQRCGGELGTSGAMAGAYTDGRGYSHFPSCPGAETA